jgi:hypothetical protein
VFFKCFNCLQMYVATVVFECFIPQSWHSIHTNKGWAMGAVASGAGWALGGGGLCTSRLGAGAQARGDAVSHPFLRAKIGCIKDSCAPQETVAHIS